MKLPAWLTRAPVTRETARINRFRADFAKLDDARLRARFQESGDLLEAIAAVAAVAARVIKLEMFDVQIEGALSLARGRIVEMQTGEGKTLASTPAIAWQARSGEGVHVMTVNNYLARRDARWGRWRPAAVRSARPARPAPTRRRRRRFAVGCARRRRAPSAPAIDRPPAPAPPRQRSRTARTPSSASASRRRCNCRGWSARSASTAWRCRSPIQRRCGCRP